MKESIDLEIPDKPLNLDQLLVDCKDTMKYGVKTGEQSARLFDIKLFCFDTLILYAAYFQLQITFNCFFSR